ncbi:N-glycosylase/DNA lyase [Schistosoma japonicum]|nr:N-glycosylase/DNA lyase [Schistosoma japonicum]
MDTSRGLRLLRQDPEETLFAFITSANNNITRITKLLRKLCIAYGNPLYLENGDVTNWTFPSLEILAQPGMHDNLKKIGFGYRSKFIECVADCICLCALDKVNVVPVDVHMRRAAHERGILESSNKNLTSKSYDIISKSLSDIWGNYAGWAQVIHFYTRMLESKPNKKLKQTLNHTIINR